MCVCPQQAFTLYEESIPDSKEQVTALQTIIASLTACHVLGADNRATLVHKTAGYCSRLLKKPDQCRAICLCSHLHWQRGPPDTPAAQVCVVFGGNMCEHMWDALTTLSLV